MEKPHWLIEVEAADDRLRREEAQRELKRQAEGRAPEGELVFKDYTSAAVATVDDSFSGWEAWLRGHLDNERTDLLKTVAKSVGEVISHERATRDAATLELKSEIAELRSRADALSVVARGMSGVGVELKQEIKQFRTEVEARERAQADNRNYIASLKKDLAGVNQELERRRLDEYMAGQTKRLDELEMRVKSLLSVVGIALDRGV
jgi:hypothetical protein